jgi:aminopeptidase N
MTFQEKPMRILIISFAAFAMASAILSAADVDPLQANSDSLRAAVDGKKGAAEIKRLAVLVLTEAKKEEAPAAADADKENHDARVKYAQGVAEYAEYALYSAASAGAPAATAADLIATLEAQSPKSKYLTEDAYLIVARTAMDAQQVDRASQFAKKALTAPKGTKPEQADAAAHYIVGIVAANKKELPVADKELRAALAGIKGIPAMEGPALYFLGEADYTMGRQGMDRSQADQGIKFLQQSALISGAYQSGARAEVARMKTELGEK